jgi:hypothetical protein
MWSPSLSAVQDGLLLHNGLDVRLLPADELLLTYEELRASNVELRFTGEIGAFSRLNTRSWVRAEDCAYRIPTMPNPLRALAGGEELYVLWLNVWIDDVSANQSKMWNKHMNLFSTDANLPGKLLQQGYFIRPLSTSAHASSAEQISAVLDAMK